MSEPVAELTDVPPGNGTVPKIGGRSLRKEKEPKRKLPRFVPWPNGRPPKAPGWWDVYVRHFAEHGGVELAANEARVHRVSVWEAKRDHAEFAQACEAAQAYYRDALQWHLVDQALTYHNPLGLFGRLKAELPHLYIEKQVTMSLEAHTTVTAEEAQELLATVLTHVTPATREMLGLPASAGGVELES